MNKEEIWNKTRHFKLESDIGNFDLIDADVYLDLLNKYDDLQQENEELKSKLENNAKINVADHKYASEMEDKYLTEHYILNEFEKWFNEEAPCYFDCNYLVIRKVDICNKLEELKGEKNE